MALPRAVVLLLFLTALSTAQSFAQTTPVWQTPADTIAVLSTGGNADFTYALVRDASMRNHNTYCVTVGAHIGKLRVAAIGPKGIVLSNGRVLPNLDASVQPATLVATGQAIDPR
ncbi:MAG TPA: hypothetical protein VMV65_02565 [Alphaproteobacteria bacterium]|nr:hypothetical protein [Alphaproteobacteria bacterium]